MLLTNKYLRFDIEYGIIYINTKEKDKETKGMGKADTITKDYMRRPDVFADVFNQFLYHGRQMILPDRLAELDTTEIAVPYGTGQTFGTRTKIQGRRKTADGNDRRKGCILYIGSRE